MKKKKKAKIEIMIVSPEQDQVFKLKTSPIETDQITLQAKVFQDGVDITRRVNVLWKLKVSWETTYKTYQTQKEISMNPAKATFKTGGILRIRASVVVDAREWSARTKASIIGTNPSKKQLMKELNSDLLMAQAFLESTWKQFDNNGQPLVNPDSSMRGLMQVSEHWWGEKSPLPLKDFNRISWQWDYNIKTAKLILDHYYKQIKRAFPRESEKKIQDRMLKAYNSGPNLKYKTDPGKYPYVQKIRDYAKKKPWEEE